MGSNDYVFTDQNSNISRKQTELEKHLLLLADEEFGSDAKDRSVEFFLNLYGTDDDGKEFRHSYSSISLVIYGGTTPETHDEVAASVKRAQGISNNLDQVFDEINEGDYDPNVKLRLMKLCDHVRLEMQRVTTFEAVYSGIEKQASEIETRFSKTVNAATKHFDTTFDTQKKKFRKIRKDIEENSEKARREYITILGIFAAIVITFMSGTAFSSSVLTNIDNASIYRLSFIVLIVGFLLFNLVFSLFIFLGSMAKDEHSFDIHDKTIRYIAIGVNAVIVVLIVVVVICRFANVLTRFG